MDRESYVYQDKDGDLLEVLIVGKYLALCVNNGEEVYIDKKDVADVIQNIERIGGLVADS